MAETTAVPKPEKKLPSVLEQLKKLDEQRAQLLTNAKSEALKKAEEAVAELKELGFDYRLVEGADSSGGRAPKKTASQTRKKSEICPVCQFGTEPLHDGRHKGHKAQQTKKAFTDKQLAEYGLTKK